MVSIVGAMRSSTTMLTTGDSPSPCFGENLLHGGMRLRELDSPLDMGLCLDHSGMAVGAGEHAGGWEDKGSTAGAVGTLS